MSSIQGVCIQQFFFYIYFIGRYKETSERALSSESFKLCNALLQNKAGTHMLLTKQVFKLKRRFLGEDYRKTNITLITTEKLL